MMHLDLLSIKLSGFTHGNDCGLTYVIGRDVIECDVIGCDVIGRDVIGCDVIGCDVIGGVVPKQ